MIPSPANELNADALPGDAPYLAATTRWLERAVIGLNLCPFARAPHVQGKLRMRVSQARDTDALLDDLCGELQSLNALTPEECETGLLIHPFVLGDFLDYNDFLDVADAAVQTLGLEGEWQVASFHPQYQFADSEADDVENFSNRSPFPTLHLLREASVERAMEQMSDTDAIYRRNQETLRRLGADGWQALWDDKAD
ncbi:DUF1415 domain-containing protein [Rhodanobacter sp. FDAARGOS 1247]|uniref:DUF1415 domain-containing protein n=1 Tax=Rhodanobacter sp. FDAARGOS 1247 TaxID=2778082 RepID=UPI00194E9D24|nr:DUF1415 domain-containing protein [Rhodanobacter sp. FDAARGOS 1247]QRP62529.1 DUF1415 domain-containing protein [Rhodanobacter sp. FDAARGOS 1247]